MISTYNIDCMVHMSKCKDKQYDLAIVDPPYGINESGQNNKTRGKLAKSKDYGNKNWDKKSPDIYYFKELIRVSKNQIIFGANHFISKIPVDSSCWIVWDKNNGDNDFADCELAWTSFKTSVRKFKYTWHGMIQDNMKNKEVRIHPTQKPVKLYEWLLINYAEKGYDILDTHMGSGSIAIACHNLEFNLTACELDKYYYQDAVQRIETHKQQLKLKL